MPLFEQAPRGIKTTMNTQLSIYVREFIERIGVRHGYDLAKIVQEVNALDRKKLVRDFFNEHPSIMDKVYKETIPDLMSYLVEDGAIYADRRIPRHIKVVVLGEEVKKKEEVFASHIEGLQYQFQKNDEWEEEIKNPTKKNPSTNAAEISVSSSASKHTTNSTANNLRVMKATKNKSTIVNTYRVLSIGRKLAQVESVCSKKQRLVIRMNNASDGLLKVGEEISGEFKIIKDFPLEIELIQPVRPRPVYEFNKTVSINDLIEDMNRVRFDARELMFSDEAMAYVTNLIEEIKGDAKQSRRQMARTQMEDLFVKVGSCRFWHNDFMDTLKEVCNQLNEMERYETVARQKRIEQAQSFNEWIDENLNPNKLHYGFSYKAIEDKHRKIRGYKDHTQNPEAVVHHFFQKLWPFVLEHLELLKNTYVQTEPLAILSEENDIRGLLKQREAKQLASIETGETFENLWKIVKRKHGRRTA